MINILDRSEIMHILGLGSLNKVQRLFYTDFISNLIESGRKSLIKCINKYSYFLLDRLDMDMICQTF